MPSSSRAPAAAPTRYQEIYPSAPLLESTGAVSATAASLLTLEYFEAPAAEMSERVFAQHHVLLNLRAEPHRVENTRDGVHREFTFRQYEIVVTPAGVRSGWRWHETSRVIVITLEPAALDRFALQELGVLLTGTQLQSLPQFHDEDICRAGELLLDALRTRAIGSDLMFESMARVFLIKLLQKYGERHDELSDARSSFTAEHYRRVLSYIEANVGADITVDDLAREVAISADHFGRLFRQVIGQTPHQFLMSYRVERARRLLTDAQRTLSEVALACGFADQAHFTRVFKQATSETPGTYRKGLTTRA
jgi:AraC family transcriptional regulator